MFLRNPPVATVVRRASCLATDQVGQCVYVTGAGTNGKLAVTAMNPAVDGSKQAVGVIKSKPSSTECVVVLSGVLKGIYSSLTPGARLFVGTDSMLTHTMPTPQSGGVMYAQLIGVAIDTDQVMVSPQWAIKQRG